MKPDIDPLRAMFAKTKRAREQAYPRPDQSQHSILPNRGDRRSKAEVDEELAYLTLKAGMGTTYTSVSTHLTKTGEHLTIEPKGSRAVSSPAPAEPQSVRPRCTQLACHWPLCPCDSTA